MQLPILIHGKERIRDLKYHNPYFFEIKIDTLNIAWTTGCEEGIVVALHEDSVMYEGGTYRFS
jgi:hypothetical protein